MTTTYPSDVEATNQADLLKTSATVVWFCLIVATLVSSDPGTIHHGFIDSNGDQQHRYFGHRVHQGQVHRDVFHGTQERASTTSGNPGSLVRRLLHPHDWLLPRCLIRPALPRPWIDPTWWDPRESCRATIDDGPICRPFHKRKRPIY